MDFVYSTDFMQINNPRFRNWCVHLICTDGEGSFVFNEQCYHLRRNDVVVLVLPHKVCNLESHPNLRVAFFAAPLQYLNSLLPANHLGIEGGIALYDNPILSLSEEDAALLADDIYRLRDRLEETSNPFYHEMMGSLCTTMIFDLFYFYTKYHETQTATNR